MEAGAAHSEPDVLPEARAGVCYDGVIGVSASGCGGRDVLSVVGV